jgi:hypothetical protein
VLDTAQTNEVATEVLKIIAFLNAGVARRGVLAFTDPDAAQVFAQRGTWLEEAARVAGVEIRVLSVDG